jgi:hypothetical protein
VPALGRASSVVLLAEHFSSLASQASGLDKPADGGSPCMLKLKTLTCWSTRFCSASRSHAFMRLHTHHKAPAQQVPCGLYRTGASE